MRELRVAGWAEVQQARDNPAEWRQGAEGYGRRLGAGFADAVTGRLISNAIRKPALAARTT
jgi:hypothetical protein